MSLVSSQLSTNLGKSREIKKNFRRYNIPYRITNTYCLSYRLRSANIDPRSGKLFLLKKKNEGEKGTSHAVLFHPDYNMH